MKKHFYDHLLEIESIYIAIDELEIQPEEKHDLNLLVDNQIHHTILDLILSHLSAEDKKKFMEYHATQKHDKVWELLNSRIDKVEEKIKATVKDLKKTLREDITEAKGE